MTSMGKDKGTYTRLLGHERELLERLAREEERTMSDILRRALRAYGKQPTGAKKSPQVYPSPGEFALLDWFDSLPKQTQELVALVGESMKSGTPRLPAHLRKALGIPPNRRRKNKDRGRGPETE